MNTFEINLFHSCESTCNHNDNNKKHLHGVVCSSSCNVEEHERVGFSSLNYTNFTKDSIYDQVDCGIKQYLKLMDTIF